MPGREVGLVLLMVVEGGDCSCGGGRDCGEGMWSWNEGGVEGERSVEEN